MQDQTREIPSPTGGGGGRARRGIALWPAGVLPSLGVGMLESFLSLEHGPPPNTVPREWRKDARLRPCTPYGLSSFNYSLVGLVLLSLLIARPERAIYSYEYFEAVAWLWQGLISFQCDVRDLGIRSYSHPVDRVSATLFTVQQCGKYLFISCSGRWGAALYAFTTIGFVVGLLSFRRSCQATRERRLADYARWHTTWHVAFPLTMAVFYLVQFLAPLEAVQCAVLSPGVRR